MAFYHTFTVYNDCITTRLSSRRALWHKRSMNIKICQEMSRKEEHHLASLQRIACMWLPAQHPGPVTTNGGAPLKRRNITVYHVLKVVTPKSKAVNKIEYYQCVFHTHPAAIASQTSPSPSSAAPDNGPENVPVSRSTSNDQLKGRLAAKER